MNAKLNDTFSALRSRGVTALMPFLTAGFPDEKQFTRCIDAYVESGADVIEVGFPHSDPLADGPVIQAASMLALRGGFTPKRGFALIEELARRHGTPFVIMCYANLVRRPGFARFVRQASDAGASGLIVPDMILEESEELRQFADRRGLAYINLVTPTTTPDRAGRIAASSSGFLYLVNVVGTTGMRSHLGNGLATCVKNIRKTSTLPCCAGFGVSSPDVARKLSRHVDGVIIGSALINLINNDGGRDGLAAVRKFLGAVRRRMDER